MTGSMTLAEARARRQVALYRKLTDADLMRYTASRDRLYREARQLEVDGDNAMTLAHQADDDNEAAEHALTAVGCYAQAKFRRARARYAQNLIDTRQAVA